MWPRQYISFTKQLALRSFKLHHFFGRASDKRTVLGHLSFYHVCCREDVCMLWKSLNISIPSRSAVHVISNDGWLKQIRMWLQQSINLWHLGDLITDMLSKKIYRSDAWPNTLHNKLDEMWAWKCKETSGLFLKAIWASQPRVWLS